MSTAKENKVLQISISSELASAHPEFMARCAERDHQVEVFESAPREGQTPVRTASPSGEATHAGGEPSR